MVMNYIPGLKLRATEEQETAGMDDTELGEFAVSHFFPEKYFTKLMRLSTIMLRLAEKLRRLGSHPSKASRLALTKRSRRIR